MSAIPYESNEEQWHSEGQETLAVAARSRRRLFSRRSAALVALIVGAIGFYTGVRVEKGHLSSSTAAQPLATRGSSTPGSGTGSGSVPRTGFPAAGAFGGGNVSLGTVSSVNGNTLYVTDGSGNTVKVELSSASKISKSLSVSNGSVHPGDSVVVQGGRNSVGTLVASSVSDSGSSSSSSAGRSAAGSASNGGSAVSSLFGATGGG